MSINALGAESPDMKRRWAAVGLAPKTSERMVASDQPSLYELSPLRSEGKKNRPKMTKSTMTRVVERVVISSYAETPAYFHMQRTISEVEESSNEGDDGSDEDHQSTIDVKNSREKIRGDNSPPLTPQKILRRLDDKDDLEPPSNIRTSGESNCYRKRTRRVINVMKKQMRTHRFTLGILIVLIFAMTLSVFEPTKHFLCDLFERKTENSIPIEQMRNSNDKPSAAPKIPHEISKKSILPNKISAKEKFKQRINTIASSVGASAFATIGGKVGSKLDARLATVNIASATRVPILAKIELIISRTLPTCSTIGTAMGASLGAMIGMKVAKFMHTNS